MNDQHIARSFCIAVVSGKGGVGKTMIASNLAWACSQVASTLLVDLDFHNQGGSGLFAPHFEFASANTFDCIAGLRTPDPSAFTKVSDTFCFLPAASWSTRPSNQEIFDLVHAPEFEQRFEGFLTECCAKSGFRIVVLDCHGGVDPTSLAALRSSNVTLMVTEADSITFAGTLELLAYFEEKISSSERGSTGKIRFIVNRLPSRYKYEQLERLYEPHFRGSLGTLSSDRSVFCYIPSEQMLADSFCDYPFYLPLAPDSIFSQKIRFIAYETLNGEFDLNNNPVLRLNKFAKPRFRQKIMRRVISNEQRNVNAVMNFFAWSCASFLLVLLTTGIYITGKVLAQPRPPTPLRTVESLSQTPALAKYTVAAITSALLIVILWYFLKALVGTMQYFRSKHQYQTRLFRALRRPASLWQSLTMSRSFILRWATTLGVWLVGLYALLMTSSIVVAVFATSSGAG